ncbi:MAG: HAD family hydrolase [Verrucomicrobiales bacterium]|nr:HAD family hydrolase [Verrucomicrobiales bacterium]
MNPHPVQALIFDFDGLIVDTEVPLFEAWQENYAAYGHDLRLEDYAGCIGTDFSGWDPKSNLENLTGGPVDWDHWDTERERHAHEKIEQLGPLPGVGELLHEAEAAGIPCAVASSSSRGWVERNLHRIGLFEKVKLTRCRDDVSAIKPDPELFQTTAEKLGVPPENAVVLEDSLNGLRAAISAGNPCVVVPNRITAHLEFEGAAARVSSMEEVSVQKLPEWIQR